MNQTIFSKKIVHCFEEIINEFCEEYKEVLVHCDTNSIFFFEHGYCFQLRKNALLYFMVQLWVNDLLSSDEYNRVRAIDEEVNNRFKN